MELICFKAMDDWDEREKDGFCHQHFSKRSIFIIILKSDPCLQFYLVCRFKVTTEIVL